MRLGSGFVEPGFGGRAATWWFPFLPSCQYCLTQPRGLVGLTPLLSLCLCGCGDRFRNSHVARFGLPRPSPGLLLEQPRKMQVSPRRAERMSLQLLALRGGGTTLRQGGRAERWGKQGQVWEVPVESLGPE